MALDMNALKAKLDKFNKTGGAGVPDGLWRPTEGRHTIRIVPWKENKKWPFIELQFHYLGGKQYLSPTSFGRRDPIAEFGEQLLGKRSKEEYEEAKPYLPKMRTHIPIIVRGEEEKGVRLFAFGSTVFKQLLEMMSLPGIDDITSIENGRDLTLTYLPKEKSDTNFAKTTVMYNPNTTPLSTDKELMKKFLTDQPDVSVLFKELSFSELKTVLSNYLDPDSATRDEPSDEPAPVQKSVTQEIAEPVEVREVEDAAMDEFDRLFKS